MMSKSYDEPQQLALASKIMEAFGNPDPEAAKVICLDRLAQLKKEKSPFDIVSVTEEQEWISALTEQEDFEDLVRRIPTSILDPEVGIALLPFLLTVKTDTPWRIGRGVLGSSIYVLKERSGTLVERLLKVASKDQLNVVCEYVDFCAEHYEDVAIKSRMNFWAKYCESLVDNGSE